MVDIPVQLFGRSDFVILPVHGHLNTNGEPHEIPTGAVAAHEKFVKILIHENHLAVSIRKAVKITGGKILKQNGKVERKDRQSVQSGISDHGKVYAGFYEGWGAWAVRRSTVSRQASDLEKAFFIRLLSSKRTLSNVSAVSFFSMSAIS